MAPSPSPPPSLELVLMLLADARLPVAGHTQSGGLEPALRGGLTASDVPAYLRARLGSVTLVEAGTAVVGLHALRQGHPLEPVDLAWAARTPSAALRRNSRLLGQGLLRLCARLWPDATAVRAVGTVPAPSRGLVWAAVGSATGLPPASLARLVGYDDVQTVSAAALKLLPLDPADTAGWVLDALPDVEELSRQVSLLTSPEDIPATGSPQIEEGAECHARTTRRLFSA